MSNALAEKAPATVRGRYGCCGPSLRDCDGVRRGESCERIRVSHLRRWGIFGGFGFPTLAGGANVLRAYGALDDETCSPVGKERRACPSASVGMTPVELACMSVLSQGSEWGWHCARILPLRDPTPFLGIVAGKGRTEERICPLS